MPSVLGLVIMNTAIWSSSFACEDRPYRRRRCGERLHGDRVEAGHRRAGRVGAVSAIGREHFGALRLAVVAEVARPRPSAPLVRRGRRRPVAANTAGSPEISREICCIHRARCSMPCIVSSGCSGCRSAKPGRRGHALVPLGVVLHRATAERVEVRIDRHVERRQIREVPHDFRLGHFRQRRRSIGECRGRQQFAQSAAAGTSHAGSRAARRPGLREFEQELRWICGFSHRKVFVECIRKENERRS